MKILAINGSPRKSGHTVELLETMMASARKQGAQMCLIHLADYHIEHCRGCYTCIKASCPQQDDMLRLLTDIQNYQADALVYGAPVFNFNLPGLLINFWNRKTGMSGYFRAKEEGRMDEWLKQNRAWKVGAGIAQAGHSGGQKTALKHINFSLLGECDRVLMGVSVHTRRWDKALEDADRLGKKLVEELEKNKGPYPLWQMPFIYKRLTCFEFPRS
ncbi:MAG: flavodoxin family protein [Candidatus Methanoperedens sp.]|nr:flavodoxin family protein [Candidatus Methanoperedens sp.]